MPVAAARWISAIAYSSNVAERRGGIGTGEKVALMADLASIGVGVVDMEIIEPARRPVAPEALRVGLDPGASQQFLELGQMVRRHLLLDAVRTQALDLALHIEAGL